MAGKPKPSPTTEGGSFTGFRPVEELPGWKDEEGKHTTMAGYEYSPRIPGVLVDPNTPQMPGDDEPWAFWSGVAVGALGPAGIIPGMILQPTMTEREQRIFTFSRLSTAYFRTVAMNYGGSQGHMYEDLDLPEQPQVQAPTDDWGPEYTWPETNVQGDYMPGVTEPIDTADPISLISEGYQAITDPVGAAGEYLLEGSYLQDPAELWAPHTFAAQGVESGGSPYGAPVTLTSPTGQWWDVRYSTAPGFWNSFP